VSTATLDARFCLTAACRAARRRDRVTVQLQLARFNQLEVLRRIELTPSEPWLTSPIQVTAPSLEERLPAWMRQVLRDQGLRLGQDVFIKKGPGTVGMQLELRW
jgi:hypothetical protein